MIHQPLPADGVHPEISSSLGLLVFCLVCPKLFVMYYCLLIFSKDSFLSLAPLTNATSAFSTLWVCVGSTNILKTLGKGEIAPTNFHQIWNRCMQSLWVWESQKFIVWERVNPFPHNDTFWRPWETTLLKTLWEKEKLLVTSNFSFTHSVFYPCRELSDIFIKFKIVVCRLFQFGPV